MSTLKDITLPLDPNQYYHIFNRGNNGQWIFYKDKNYPYFLEKYKDYMLSYWDTYAYCLLPNHFHLLIKVKSEAALIEAGQKDFTKVSKQFLKQFSPTSEITNRSELFNYLVHLQPEQYPLLFNQLSHSIFREKLLQWIVSERFRRFLLAYAKAINNQEKRTGSLFQKLFRRKHIDETSYLSNAILYINRNPVHHGNALILEDWRWTSYKGSLSMSPTNLKRNEILNCFNGKARFIELHQQYTKDWLDGQKWIIEE